VKEFAFPIRTTPWGSIKAAQDYEKPDLSALGSAMLSHEPAALHIDALPTINKTKA
jgi:adenylylsulfate reductase subunit B